MFIKYFDKCTEIVACDNTVLRELLNPLTDDISVSYSLAHAKVKPGETSLKHKLKSSEVYCILDGQGEMYIDDEKEEVSAGDTVYIPPGSLQYIKNIGNKELLFLCIVEPAWKQEDEEVIN